MKRVNFSKLLILKLTYKSKVILIKITTVFSWNITKPIPEFTAKTKSRRAKVILKNIQLAHQIPTYTAT